MIKIILSVLLIAGTSIQSSAQKTQIRGFMDFGMNWWPNVGDVSFVLGEQDLLITSDISDKITFLGESVFKYSATSSTNFTVGLERAVFKYNYKGNHNFVLGKFHTPVNYWNDSYHHGRVFFPTVGRPETFNSKIIPIHQIGIGMEGSNLGQLKFGYNLMLGNGLGATSIKDNNLFKAITIAGHMKPMENFRIGLSAYFDQIEGGSKLTGEDVQMGVYSASVAYFKKFELLAEYSLAQNSTDSLGAQTTHALYVYAGYKIKDIIVPYFRFDYLEYDLNEMYYNPVKTNAYTFGVRYEINYLTALKVEYQVLDLSNSNILGQKIRVQLAIGF